MKKSIILILFMLALPSVFSSPSTLDDSTWTVMWNESFDSDASFYPAYTCTIASSEATCTNAQFALFKNRTINMSTNLGGNSSIRLRIKFPSQSDKNGLLFRNVNTTAAECSPTADATTYSFRIYPPDNDVQLISVVCLGGDIVKLFLPDNTYQIVDIIRMNNGSADVYLNQSYKGNFRFASAIMNNHFLNLGHYQQNFHSLLKYLPHHLSLPLTR